MTLFRYECEYPSLDVHTGICTCADDLPLPLDDDWNDVIFMMEDFLPLPSISMTNTIAFFTPKGHKKIRKGVRKMAKGIASIQAKISLWHVEMDAISSLILYKDRYQVIADRCDDIYHQMKLIAYL